MKGNNKAASFRSQEDKQIWTPLKAGEGASAQRGGGAGAGAENPACSVLEIHLPDAQLLITLAPSQELQVFKQQVSLTGLDSPVSRALV